jgi:hypothetical protein
VVVKPLSDASLCFDTCVIMRADESCRLVNEYVRIFLRQAAPPRRPPKPTDSSMSARVVSLKAALPAQRS